MKIHKLFSGFEFCSSSGQHRYGNEEMGEAFYTGTSSPSDQADVSLARRGHEEFVTEGGGENESLVRGGISEEDGADLLVGEKNTSSSLETGEVKGGLEMSEKEDGESDLEKSGRLGRVLRNTVGSAGKGAATKALRKQGAVAERLPPKKRRLASQGKLKQGDRLKVTCLYLY